MPYVKTTWVSGSTPTDAAEMNNVENGVSGAYTQLESITGNDGVTQATTDGPFTLANFVNFILKAIRNITGAANWYDAPAATLSGLNANKLNASAYTASDVLAKVKTVDGSGSGLDADTLDGHDSSFFAPAGNYAPLSGATFTGAVAAPSFTGDVTGDLTGTASAISTTTSEASSVFGFPLDSSSRTVRQGSSFGGTGAGTFTHGLGALVNAPAAPSWIGITDHASGSTMTVGVDTLGATTCSVNAGASHAWLGFAIRM